MWRGQLYAALDSEVADNSRWSLQHNMITLPKSSRKDRLVENVKVNEFEISGADLATMDGLDENLVTDW